MMEKPERKIIDLTHTLYNGLQAFPGNLDVSYKPIHEIENGGYRVSTLHMDGHTGTHVDIPRHVFDDGRTLEKLDLNKCIGIACKIKLNKNKGDEILVEDLKPYEKRIQNTRRLIIETGWSKYFGKDEFYQDYPGISPEAASWLVNLGICLVGIDFPSVHFTKGLEVHHIFLKSETVIVEALTCLEKIPQDKFEVICLPLRIKEGDGSPTRVVAFV